MQLGSGAYISEAGKEKGLYTGISDPVVSTPRLACLSSLKRIKFSKGEIATFIWPWHSPLKSVILYQPQINWKPERSGERSTEAKPITLSSSPLCQTLKTRVCFGSRRSSFDSLLRRKTTNNHWCRNLLQHKTDLKNISQSANPISSS